MQLFYQLAHIIRLIPVPARWISSFFIVLPVVFILSRTLGLKTSVSLWVMGGIFLLMLLLWGIGGLKRLRDRKRSQDFESDLGMHSKQGPASQEEIREAVRELQDQWQDAMREFKSRGKSIYELPWFLLIGEPQSGKSTTLRESSLEFPIGQEAISGAGGTRNCDWWFTEEAIILDTAGRFSFQEGTAPDRHEWEAFLKLLGRHRKECPVNGALVVIPATSLVQDPPEEQEAKAKNIRKKLMQLQNGLDIRFPIFILITKADRILGFAEFFDNLDPGYQHQIFGWSNPDNYDQRWEPKSLEAIFNEISLRIHKTRLRYLGRLGDTDQVDRMFVFPEELAALREPLEHYLHNLFHGSRWEEHFIFRGFYFTSGIQEGRPIARACQDLLRVSAGDPQGVLEDLETTFHRSRAFFINDLYEKKVFPEKGLVKRTESALKKEKTYRRVFWSMIGAAGVAALFLLAPAVLNLMRMLGPINKLTAEASECLEEGYQCGVRDSYELVHEIEQTRIKLEQERWVMRLMLQGNQRNEIVNELLPTVQAGLLRRGVLKPVLESFEARSAPDMWNEGDSVDYDLYHAAFQNRLRFDQYQAAAADREQLRQETHLGPLLLFLEARKGEDPSQDGTEIDEWLAETSHIGDIDEADRIFRSVVTADERFDLMKVGQLEKSQNALAAFERYWSVQVLARWDFELIDNFLQAYQATYDGILDLDGASLGGEQTLASFHEEATKLGDIYARGQRHMASRSGTYADLAAPEDAEDPGAEDAVNEVEAEGDDEEEPRRRLRRKTRRAVEEVAEGARQLPERPGQDLETWRAFCREDYGSLLEIFERLTSQAKIEEHCDVRIPDDWKTLVDGRKKYDHLYDDRDSEGRPALAWSTDAGTLQTFLVNLAERAKPETVLQDAADFQKNLEQRTGDRDRLDLIQRRGEAWQNDLRSPVAELAELEAGRTDPRFRIGAGQRRAAEIAALATGLRILPPVEGFLADKFRTDCSSCFSLDHAKTFVPPANGFLRWSNGALEPATGVQEIRQPIERINQALFAYLESFLGRDRVTGTGFRFPYSASGASTWPRFAAAIRDWQLTVSADSLRSESGLTLAVLRDFIKDNDRLAPLLDRFRESRASARPVKIPADLERAIARYKATFDRLNSDALTAWKQLARGEDGVSLDDFHAFSRSRGLRQNRQTKDLITKVEDHGAALMSQEIRPLFEAQAEKFWRFQERCCRNRFPFIDALELRRLRLAYERGYHAGRNVADLWGSVRVDRVQRTVTLPIQLDTVGKDDLDSLFFSGGQLDRLFDEFAVDPILEVDRDGKSLTSVDFLSPNTSKYRVLRNWQRFFYGGNGDDRAGRRLQISDQDFKLRILERESTAERTYLGERVSQVDLFGPYPIRPSTDADRGIEREVPLRLDDNPLPVDGINEDDNGWRGRLEINGGPLKLLYFVHLGAERGALEDGRVWTVRIEIPDFERPQKRLEGIFEIEFERPVPGVFPPSAKPDS